MAEYTKSVSTSIVLTDSHAQDRHLTDVLDCIANDLDFVDGRVTITLTRKGTATLNALEGTITTAGDNTQIVVATRTQVTLRDIQQSNAFLRVGDVKFRVAENDTEWQPLQGDVIHWNGVKHEVLAVDIKVMGTAYLLWCRRV